MLSTECRISPQSVAELSLVLSRLARRNIDEFAVHLPGSLQTMWLNGRSLERQWTVSLEKWRTTAKRDVSGLSKLTAQILAFDLLVRTWGTILAMIDSRVGGTDAVRLVRNATNGLAKLRNSALSQILDMPDDGSIPLVHIDRMYRRHQRWVDVMIGTMSVSDPILEFAYDQDRVRDFSEEISFDWVAGPNPADHFVSAGMRMNFVRYLSSEPYDGLETVDLVKSILSNLPATAFRSEGTLRSLLELRIVKDRNCDERMSDLVRKSRLSDDDWRV